MDKTFAGKTFSLRPLTRGEVKELRKKGYNLANLNVDSAEDCMDEVISMVLPQFINDIDALPNPSVLGIFQAIIELTYGGESEKNSLTTGDGIQDGQTV